MPTTSAAQLGLVCDISVHIKSYRGHKYLSYIRIVPIQRQHQTEHVSRLPIPRPLAPKGEFRYYYVIIVLILGTSPPNLGPVSLASIIHTPLHSEQWKFWQQSLSKQARIGSLRASE